VPPPKTITPILKEELVITGEPKMWFLQKIQEIEKNPKYNLNDMSDVAHLSFKAELLVHDTFLNEYECMVNFVMISIQNSRIRADQINKGFLRFLTTKSDIFHALGIPFVIPTSGTLSQRMEQVQQQIDQLDADKRKIFDQLKLLYEQEQLAGKSMSDAAREEERKKQEERSKIAEEQARKKREELIRLQEEMEKKKDDDIDINMDIDSMPDCRLKYEIIVRRAKANGAKFSDS
jgi:hypothetical protein